jgi:hypothetical protein
MQVVRLHERSSSYLAELEELKTAKSSRSLLLATMAPDPQAAAAGAGVAAHAAAADRELMLKQIDSLKEVSSMPHRAADYGQQWGNTGIA